MKASILMLLLASTPLAQAQTPAALPPALEVLVNEAAGFGQETPAEAAPAASKPKAAGTPGLASPKLTGTPLQSGPVHSGAVGKTADENWQRLFRKAAR